MTRFLVIGRPGSSPATTFAGDEKTTVLLALSDPPGALLVVLEPLGAPAST